MIQKYIKPGTQLAVRLSARERDLVIERAFLDPEVEMSLQQAVPVGSELVVNLNLDDIDNLLGCVAAEANHCDDGKVQRVLDAVCDRLSALLDRFTDKAPAAEAGGPSLARTLRFTAKQGQYLAFIHWYMKLHRISPAEADLQRYFKVTPSAVHTMILTLERQGLIDRRPGQARSIRLRVPAAEIPALLGR
jgi:DNA-binding MarR family transcriptional regulator